VTVTTVRPDATVRNVSVNTSGGASAFSVLDDSPDNDATIAQGAVANGYVLLGLATTTVGATNRVLRARVRGRVLHGGVDLGHVEKVNVNLYDPTTGKYGLTTGFGTSNTSVWQAVSAGYESTPPGGTAWSQAIVDRLQLRALWIWSTSHSDFVKLSELYVDLDINAQPVVSAVTVTGATTTTRPDVSWTFSDGDGDLQVAYQVKVFSAAQYGAVGFDPETSTATWDSGVVLGDAVAATTGADLVNGTTYKWYVKAGQAWPAAQGLGTVWYSDWAASSATAIALTPPPVPAITVSQQTGLPGYRNLIRVTAPINLLTANQASLETDTTGWAAVTNCTISRSTAYFLDGAASLQLSSSASGNMSAATSVRPRIEPGARLVVTATGRTAVSVRSVRIDIRWYDVTGTLISTTTGTAANDATGSDTPWWATGVAPATTYTADLLVNVLSTGGASEVHRFDKLGMFYNPTDPGTAAAAAALWTPGGYVTSAAVTVYRAQRISKTIARGPARNWLHPQLFSAGALTALTDGFYPRQANDSVAFLPMDRPSPEGTSQVSAGMIEWTIRTGAFSYLDIGALDGSAIADGMPPYLMPAVPGKSMTASVWLWADAAITIRLGIIYTDRYNTQVGSTTLSANTGLTTTEQKVSVAATPPAGAAFARMVIEDTNGVNGFRVYVAMPRFRVTSDPDENWPGQVFSWETEEVRQLTSAAFADGQNDVAIYDHEPPAGRPVLYWARITALTATGQTVASADSTAVHVYQDPPARSLLKDPYQPENAYLVRILHDQDLTQEEDAGTFHPLGRDGDPVVWRDWLGGVDGRIGVFATSDLDRYRLDQIHPSARPLLIQWAAGGNTYIRIVRRSQRPLQLSAGRWRYDFDYVQVGRP
jgi:hypothetical protein